MPESDNHVFLLSYNRPGLLLRTLDALSRQTYRDWQITLVQDGPRNPADPTERALVRQCVEGFRSFFPQGAIIAQTSNLGIGLNTLSAQRRAFNELGLDSAFFFEDDLLPHATYLAQLTTLRHILAPHANLAPYFACYGRLHSFSPEHSHVSGCQLRFMDQALWGYGLFRGHWEQEQQLLKPYFAYLETIPYRERNHGVIQRIFRQLGHQHSATSQDGARIVALCVLGRCALTTIPRRASYIGEIGEHSTETSYRSWGFCTEPLPDDLPICSPQVREGALREACARFPEWVQTLEHLPPYRIAQLEHDLVLKDRQIAALSEKASLLEAIRKSTFWRASAPVRYSLDKLRTARRRLFRKASVPLRYEQGTIAIDVSTIWHHDAGTGIQRVVRKIATTVAIAGQGHKKIALVDYSGGVPLDVTDAFLGLGERAAARREVTGMEMLVMLDSSYNLAPSFSRRLRDAKRDGIFVVSICHDLLPVTNPAWFLAVNHIPFRRWLKLAAHYSNAFLCVSETTASRLRKHLAAKNLPAPPSVASWPLGHDLDSWAAPATGDAGTGEPFALMVGTVEPRKNHIFVLETLANIHAAGGKAPKLVVVGRYGWKSKAAKLLLREAVVGGWAEWHDQGVTDETLSDLYAHASCVIQASLDEGFGLPVAEAAAMGKPVVLSDIPVFREIVRDNGYFFTLGNEKSFTAALLSACDPQAQPTVTRAVSWRESAGIFWRRCLELQDAENSRNSVLTPLLQ